MDMKRTVEIEIETKFGIGDIIRRAEPSVWGSVRNVLRIVGWEHGVNSGKLLYLVESFEGDGDLSRWLVRDVDAPGVYELAPPPVTAVTTVTISQYDQRGAMHISLPRAVRNAILGSGLNMDNPVDVHIDYGGSPHIHTRKFTIPADFTTVNP
jgi:hypothetical protein